VHVVCECLGNSERVAEKHYLHVTNEHLAAGSTKTTVEKLGPKLGPATALITPHSMSVDSQTLEKPSFPLIAPHAMRGVCSQVGDEGGELWCSKAFIYRSNVRAGHFSGGAGGGAHAT